MVEFTGNTALYHMPLYEFVGKFHVDAVICKCN